MKRIPEELRRKLRRVEALYERPGSEGEKQAAARAIARLQKKIGAFQKYENQKIEIREVEFEVFTQA